MPSVSGLIHLIEKINSCLPANKGVEYGRRPNSKSDSGFEYTIYATLRSPADKDVVISSKELLAGSLKECRIFLEGMYMMEKIKASNYKVLL